MKVAKLWTYFSSVCVCGTCVTMFLAAASILFQTNIVGDRAGGAAGDALQVHIDALKVQEHVEAAFALTRDIVQEINRLVIGLETGTGGN